MMIVRDVIKNALAAAPGSRSLVNRHRLSRGCDPEKDSVEYVRSVFGSYAERFHDSARAGRLLEIGPGGNLGVAMLFVDHGAEHVDAIDTIPWSGDNSGLYEQLLADPKRPLDRVSYHAPVDIATTAFPSETFDGIYSHAVLEHVLRPRDAIAQMYRLLKPGGIALHGVDLRDHRDFSRPLDFLRYSDRTWQLASSHRGCGGNRWRRSDYETAFIEAGFSVVEVEARGRVSVQAEQRSAFSAPFRCRELEDLEVIEILIQAVK